MQRDTIGRETRGRSGATRFSVFSAVLSIKPKSVHKKLPRGALSLPTLVMMVAAVPVVVVAAAAVAAVAVVAVAARAIA